uniref:Uncharacterized protein n=1 Tax=Amphimedon queenslandica TaxID=400682 RepID=A0A1X7SWH9_AMPQE
WLEDTFLSYLDEWDTSVKSQEVTNAEKKAMTLSTETLDGLRMTMTVNASTTTTTTTTTDDPIENSDSVVNEDVQMCEVIIKGVRVLLDDNSLHIQCTYDTTKGITNQSSKYLHSVGSTSI